VSGGAGWAPAATGLVATALACGTGVWLARRAGWGDVGAGGEARRKLQERPVPPVGGPAILVGLLAVRAAGALPWAAAGAPTLLARSGEAGAWAALLVAFAVGLVDDLRPGGLRPGSKLVGQALAGLALAAPGWGGGAPAVAVAATALGVLSVVLVTNLWNTFDNADGAAGGLAALGLGVAGAPAGAAALGFLPWNLLRAGPATSDPRPPGGTGAAGAGCGSAAGNRSAARRAPHAYLGDSGSHLLGVLVLLSPAAWPALLLPALDLGRLVFVRLRAGEPPWRGDRRHLAHRLQARGLPAPAVLAVLLAIGGTPLLVRGPLGAALTLAGFGAALAASGRRGA
jgi:UDP-N-acetylmuramyl pentapeptide phosphotransferase/UDP-N-acetylglucosamine-1-phosphate transferase